MTVDQSAATIIRASSGALFALLGIAVAILGKNTGRANARTRAFATFAIGFGLSFVVFNLLVHHPKTMVPAFWLNILCWAVAATGAGMFLFAYASDVRGARFARRMVFIGVAIFVASMPYLLLQAGAINDAVGVPEPVRPHFVAVAHLQTLTNAFSILVSTVAAIYYRTAVDESQKREAWLLGLGFAIYPAFTAGELFLVLGKSGTLAYFVLAIMIPVAAWLYASAAPKGGRAALTGLGILAFAFAGEWETAYYQFQSEFVGVIRAIAFVVLAVAMFRYELRSTETRSRVARRGPWVAAALAALFIVAQIAQNNLGPRVSLIVGAISAGTLTLAVAPVQRALERSRQAAAPPVQPGPVALVRKDPSDPSTDRAYTLALRAALADGTMTTVEEEHLAALAEELGIGAAAALRMRRAVDAEYQRSRRGRKRLFVGASRRRRVAERKNGVLRAR